MEQPPITLEEFRNRADRDALVTALRQSHGDRDEAAKILAVHRATLFRLLGQHKDIAAQFPEKPGPQKKDT